jgi:hypothetical protein
MSQLFFAIGELVKAHSSYTDGKSRFRHSTKENNFYVRHAGLGDGLPFIGWRTPNRHQIRGDL